MKRTNGWINAFFALIFIAIPSVVGYYFFSPDWNADVREWWFYLVVSLGFIAYVSLVCYMLIAFKVLGLDSLAFNIPITLVFIAIFVSFDWHIAIRIVLGFLAVMSALPILILINVYKDKKIREINKRNKYRRAMRSKKK